MKNDLSFNRIVVCTLDENMGVISRLAFFLFLSLYFHPLSAAPIDSCRVRVLYKYYTATQDRKHKPVTDSIGTGMRNDMLRYCLALFLALLAALSASAQRTLNGKMWVTQNCPEEGTMTVEDALHPAVFVYTEPMDSMRWDLMPGDTTILDYPRQRHGNDECDFQWLPPTEVHSCRKGQRCFLLRAWHPLRQIHADALYLSRCLSRIGGCARRRYEDSLWGIL